MAKYIATGADKDTGAPREEIIFAADERQARAVASHRGLMVESMRDVTAHRQFVQEAEDSAKGWTYNDNGVERGPIELVFWSCLTIVMLWMGGCCCVRCTRHVADSAAKTSAVEGNGKRAAIIAQDYVSDELKSPSTAKFESINSARITRHGADEYTVSSWVDATNGFGAVIRTRYTVRVRDNGDGSWKLVSRTLH